MSCVFGILFCVAHYVLGTIFKMNDGVEGIEAFGSTILYSPVSAILILYFGVALLYVGSLCCFHLYLVSGNQTTYEHV